MVAVIDYNAGNLKSVCNLLKKLQTDAVVVKDADSIRRADKVILPGVGAFGDAMTNLTQSGLIPVIGEVIAANKPFLGICVGLQLLFEGSEEDPDIAGLGILSGQIRKIPDGSQLKIPHMGWNNLKIKTGASLFQGIDNGAYVYFVHSYYPDVTDKDIVAATTEYGITLDVSIERGNLFGCQFHPEKSGDIGANIVQNFLDL